MRQISFYAMMRQNDVLLVVLIISLTFNNKSYFFIITSQLGWLNRNVFPQIDNKEHFSMCAPAVFESDRKGPGMRLPP